MRRAAINVHAAKNVFFLTCFGSVLLSRAVSVLRTRHLMQVASNSPVVFKASIVIGIPMIQTMMVIPWPRGVLGVICPYPDNNNNKNKKNNNYNNNNNN